MKLHSQTFHPVEPNEDQRRMAAGVRAVYEQAAERLCAILPDGPDTTHAIRVLRDSAMWAMQSLLRNPDGSPRASPTPAPAKKCGTCLGTGKQLIDCDGSAGYRPCPECTEREVVLLASAPPIDLHCPHK